MLAMGLHSLDRPKGAYPRQDFLRNAHKCSQQRLVDVEFAFIFGDIAFAMRLIDNSPLLRWQVESMSKALKN